MSKRKRKKHFGKDVSYWQSYSDMMAAVLLVMVLILSFSMLESRKEIESEKIELDNQKALYKEQEEQLKKQEVIYEEQTELIKKQQEKLDRVIGVKSEIITAIQKEFKNSQLAIKIDDKTGAISFDSDLLFDPDKAVLKEKSKDFLDEFLPRYFSVLMSEKYKDNVAEIVIEGHTAHYGTYMGCLELSQERALAVAKYALADDSSLNSVTDMEVLRTIVTVNGRAWYDPAYFDDGTIDDSNSRRVEIKFRLKDEEMVQEMLDILSEGDD